MKTLAIIQARMGSTRLPGKMLLELGNKPLVMHALERASKAKLVDKVILASTISEKDEKLLDYVNKQGFDTFAGSEEDVLDRIYQAAKKFKADIIVRLTGDCPLIDPEIIDKVIKKLDGDYAGNVVPPTFPDGLDVEVLPFRVLENLWETNTKKHEREHVTPHIRENPEKYKITNLNNEEDLSGLRFTVDNKEDLEFVREVYKRVGTDFRLKDILRILGEEPKLLKINQKYERHDGFSGWKKHWKEGKNVINNFTKSLKLLEEAKKIIPSAAQTYSKSYKYFPEGVAPAFLSHGEKGHVWDIDGNEYIDFVCGLGPVTIGYNNKEINEAVIEQLSKGISFTLPVELEVKLAKKLVEVIPCAEMVKFVKNGSDATTAAIRLARAFTKRDIVACCGYHGYHAWYIGTTENDAGVPEAVKKLTKKFEYNNIKSLKKIFDENKVAAVILEPCPDLGPKDGFLEKVKEVTHKNKAVLIFDEVVSGFRNAMGGAQEVFGVIPDLTTVGKGMGNGLAISAVVGKKEIMKLIDEGAFISTTFGGEATALIGALKTIEILERPDSLKHIHKSGNLWISEVKKLIEKKNLKDVVRIYGLSPHCGVVFKNKGSLTNFDLLSIYQQKLIEQGILSIGVNNFCLEHTEEDVEQFIKAVDLAFDDVLKAIKQDSVEEILKGEKFRPIFTR